MNRLYRHINVEKKNDVCCVRFRTHKMDESDILEMTDEVLSLIDTDGCRKMVVALGPGQLECLYSVFLAKMVMFQRHLVGKGGQMKICEATPETMGVFEACHLKEYFDFIPDQAAAVAALTGN